MLMNSIILKAVSRKLKRPNNLNYQGLFTGNPDKDIFSLDINDKNILNININEFYKFCQDSQSKSLTQWTNLLKDIANNQLKTLDEMLLFRSLCITIPALGLNYSNNFNKLETNRLYNNFFINYNGQIGPQQSIYFLNNNYNIDKEEIFSLYNLGLLNSFTIKTDEKIIFHNYFTPLVWPRVMTYELHNSNNIWRNILNDRHTCMRKDL